MTDEHVQTAGTTGTSPQVELVAPIPGRVESRSNWSTFMPLVLSAAALGFSIWSWWFSDVQNRESLVAIPNELTVPLDEELLERDSYKGTIAMTLFIVNHGNRPAAVLDAGMQFRPHTDSKTLSVKVNCSLADNGKSETEPLAGITKWTMPNGMSAITFSGHFDPPTPVVEPGKIIKIALTFNVHFGWDEFAQNRNVNTCIQVRTLDNQGVIRGGLFPISLIRFTSPSDPQSSSGYEQPSGSWKLL